MSRAMYVCPICGNRWSDMPIEPDATQIRVWCDQCRGKR